MRTGSKSVPRALRPAPQRALRRRFVKTLDVRDTRAVGRGEELAGLIEAAQRAAEGEGAFDLIVGPAGIGKTHLADALAATVREQGFVVHWASCWDGPAPPLWPWAQLVRAIHGHDLPEAETPFGRFDAIVGLVQAAANDHASLIVIDDVHNADRDSLEVLDLLVRQRRGHRQLILATGRLDGAGPDLLALARRAEIVELGGLGRDDIVVLIEAAGVTVDSAAVDLLHDATGGNPFFVLELVRALKPGRRGEGVLPPLPPSVVEVIRRSLADLDPVTRRVLDAAAVQGRVFEPAVLAACLELPRSAVDGALAAAARAGIVSATPPHDRFAHALTVDAVRGLLDPAACARLHLASARVATSPERVAAHLVSAGDLVDLDRLVTACRDAARVAASAFAHADAARHLHAASEECARRGSPRADLLLELCAAQKAARDLAGARASALAAASLARARGDDMLLARSALAMPPDNESIEVDQLADEDQIALREEAIIRLPRDEATAASLMAALAMSLYWAVRTGDRAVDHRSTAVRREHLTSVAMQRARRSGDEATLAACLSARLYALWGPDAPPGRGKLVAELIELSERLDDGALRLEALGWAVVDALARGDHRGAVAAVADHGRLAETRHDPAARWTSLRWQASLAILEGRLEDGEALVNRAARLGRTVVGPYAAELFAMVPLGQVRSVQGRLGEAYALVQATADDPANVPAWRTGVVTTAFAAGDVDTARRELRALAQDDFGALPRDLDWLSSLVTLAPTVRELGEVDAACSLVQLLEPHADDHALVGLGYASYGPVRRAIALARETIGDLAGAETELLRALERLDPDHTLHATLCRADLDRVRLAAGARPRAVLRPEGDHWLVAAPGAPAARTLRAQRGLVALRALLRASGPVSALDLAWAIDPPENPDPDLRRVLSARTHEPVLDGEALRSYRRRVEHLRSELDAADRAGDAERSVVTAVELDRLERELRTSTGADARSRRAPDASERARTRVTKLLRRAVAQVSGVDPALGSHLDRSVKTGSTCAYDPPPGERWEWDLG